MSGNHSAETVDKTAWKALAYFSLYRLLVACFFATLDWIGQLPEPLGVDNRMLFAVVVNLYLFISLSALFFIHIRKPPYVFQVAGQVFADIILITLLMYASAGLNSGFGMLLVIVVAGGALLRPGRIGILFAAIATISVLGHEVYVQLTREFPPPNYIHAGFLGVTFFITAFISYMLASRVQQSEALAEQRAMDLENLAQLNEHIVQRLQSGILVLDDKLRVILLNEAARNLLHISGAFLHRPVSEVSAALAEHVRGWIMGTDDNTVIIRPVSGGDDVQASFTQLRLENKYEILIFLDDVSMLRQRVQQMKLASLGRLAASIAHEIRNPLGAISHANQLLSEAPVLTGEEKRLTAIIGDHSVRMNNVIENVLSISRREQSALAVIELGKWLTGFTEEFIARNNLEKNAVRLKITPAKVMARMDPSQLRQVLWNICENGIRYGGDTPLIELNCGIKQDTERPFVDIIDHGPGIAAGIEEQLFEPFVTTESKGTGLGLFIARELCEANQASLSLHANSTEGCCFRIVFSHPEKRQGLV